MYDSIFDAEDRGSTFVQNVSKLLPDYMVPSQNTALFKTMFSYLY
jgi:hypothetical protein